MVVGVALVILEEVSKTSVPPSLRVVASVASELITPPAAKWLARTNSQRALVVSRTTF